MVEGIFFPRMSLAGPGAGRGARLDLPNPPPGGASEVNKRLGRSAADWHRGLPTASQTRRQYSVSSVSCGCKREWRPAAPSPLPLQSPLQTTVARCSPPPPAHRLALPAVVLILQPGLGGRDMRRQQGHVVPARHRHVEQGNEAEERRPPCRAPQHARGDRPAACRAAANVAMCRLVGGSPAHVCAQAQKYSR